MFCYEAKADCHILPHPLFLKKIQLEQSKKQDFKLPIITQSHVCKLCVHIYGNMGKVENGIRVIFILSFIFFWIFCNKIDNIFTTKEEKSKWLSSFVWLPSDHYWANSDVTWMFSIWLRFLGCNRQAHQKDSWLHSSQGSYHWWEFQGGYKGQNSENSMLALKWFHPTKSSLECQFILSMTIVAYVLLYPGVADQYQQNHLSRLQWWEM